jgi:hypothetical protein
MVQQQRRQMRPTRVAVLLLAFTAAALAGLLIFWAIDSAQGPSEFQRLVGRWQRTEGDYILDVQSVSSDGKIEARYFNPKPIHVAAARATMVDGEPRLFIELRDINYPGSTYTLTYNRQSDQLDGVYYQALQEMSFFVTFVRK